MKINVFLRNMTSQYIHVLIIFIYFFAKKHKTYLDTSYKMYVKNRYQIVQQISHGTFGDIYLGKDIQKNRCGIRSRAEDIHAYSEGRHRSPSEYDNQVAIKYDSTELGILRHEATILNYLIQRKSNLHIPRVYWYGLCTSPLDDNIEKQCIVMSYFNGGTLTKHLPKIDNHTLILWMQKMLLILKQIHELYVIHRDIKPDNIMLHISEDSVQFKLIDFGLSTFYIDGTTNQHVPRNIIPSTELTGSPLYVSLNTHQGIKPSRRDDCIQLGYVYLYMSLGGHLPWEGISINTNVVSVAEQRILESSSIEHPINQERAQLKQNYVSQDPLWTSYMQRCMELKYDETPDYIF